MSYTNKTKNPSGEHSQMLIFIMRNKATLEKILAIVLALLVWQIVAKLVNNTIVLVTPMVVIHNLMKLCITADFWDSVLFSIIRIQLGFVLALCIGTILATLAGKFRFLEVLVFPYMAVIKATPVASFIILCLIWLDSKNLSVFIAFLMILPIIYTNVLQGMKSFDPKLLEMSKLFEITWWRKLKFIVLPQLKPYILSACSVGIGLSWKAGVAAEVIGIPEGSIGEKLYEAKIYLNSGELFAWTVVIVIVSILFEKLIIYLLKSLFGRG